MIRNPNLHPYLSSMRTLSLFSTIQNGAILLSVIAAATCSVGCKKYNHRSLPVEASRLPVTTKFLYDDLIEETREEDPTVRKAYLASRMVPLCRPGATNPAHRLELLPLLGSKVAKDLFDVKDMNETKQLLDCGVTVSESLRSDAPFFTTLRFDGDKPAEHVIVAHLGVKELPSSFGYQPTKFGTYSGVCRPGDAASGLAAKDAAGKECKDGSFAAMHDGAAWFIGNKSTLLELEHSLAKPREQIGGPVAALQAAADGCEGLPERKIEAELKTAKDYLRAPCHWAAEQTAGSVTEFMDLCFPSNVSRDMDSIDGKVRAVAFELDSEVRKAGAVHGNIVLVARDNDDAKALEIDARDLVNEWKSHIDSHADKIYKQAKSTPVTLWQHDWVAISDEFVSAIKKMQVTRDGRVVRLNYNQTLSAEDKVELEEANRKNADKRKAVATVLDAIQSKRSVPADALAKLTGRKWATFLATPRGSLVPADCDRIKKSVAKLKFAALPDAESKTYYGQVRGYSCSAAMDLPQAQLDCLLRFDSPKAFAQCATLGVSEPSESDFGKQ